jgi:HmuY protein
MRVVLICICTIIFSSCEKQELPIKSFNRGGLLSTIVPMGSNYSNQVYMKLNTNSIVQLNNKFTWDLGFSCSLSKNTIFLNSSKAMYVREISNALFSSVIDTNGFEKYKKWDASSAHLDSTAFGTKLDTASVFVIFLGYSEIGVSLGFKKLKFKSVDNQAYVFEYSNLNGTEYNLIKIRKDNAYHQLQFSFKINDIVAQEPLKNSYDLLFTQYTYTFYNPFQSYLVTGVLINREKVKVGYIRSIAFTDITISDTASLVFSNRADAIGYNWKEFNFNDNKFTVDPTLVYLIMDQEGFYYKLHFIDFYNEQGQKGYPKYEFQKL